MATDRRDGGSAWGRFLAALDQAPEPHWFSQLVHHGARVALLLFTALVIHALFPAPRVSDVAVLEPGVVAPNDVIAEFTFDIPKTPDELLREQVEAASGVPPVYARNPAVRDSVLRSIRGFFAAADSLSATPATSRDSLLRALIERNRIDPTPEAVEALRDPQERTLLRRSIETAISEAYAEGIAPSSLGQGVSAVKVRSPEGLERIVPRDSLLTADRFFGRAVEKLPASAVRLAELQRLILIRFFQPSLVYDEIATEAARDRAREAVDPVKATVLQGEKIIGAHERVGEEEEARLQAYEAELSSRGIGSAGESQSLTRSLGAVLYNALVIGILGALLFFFRRPLYGDARSVLLLTSLIITVCGTGAVIARLALPIELIPVTFAALIVAVLWDGRLGLSLSLLLALLLAGQTPFLGVTAPFTTALAGSAATFSVRVVERRSKTWIFIAIISAAYVAAAVTMGLMRSRGIDEIAMSAAYGVANAIVASLLAIGFLPLLESFTGITTDQTLLELSDPNRKLLKRLSLEAPGTYAHTVSVANLAEAACHAIGANGLLARVGAYYHDIGKLVKPQYFIENQPRGRNPHDRLRPAMSATIIRSHVQEGIKLVEAEHLPAVVRNFIPEHHGTQQIAFFFNRARELDPAAHVNPTDFTYPGPKPQSRETAVLMLADAAESATRALPDPTPARIRELVERLVAQRIAEGQLDESPLTLREIGLVKESLTGVLSGMYHHRIDYPAAPTATEPVAAAAEPSLSER